jgi:hypothetical protein
MNNYEVVEVFEVGNAGAAIRDKGFTDIDEHSEPLVFPSEALDE